MNTKELTKIFLSRANRDTRFQIARSLIERSCADAYWVCGGFVYRTLSQALHGYGGRIPDIDIMTAPLFPLSAVTADWNIVKNHFGGPKLIHQSGLRLDVWQLRKLHYAKRTGLRPTLNVFLRGVPLSIQSIAYDARRNILIGKAGIRSLLQRTVGVNNRREMLHHCERYGIKPREYIEQKAASLRFSPIYD